MDFMLALNVTIYGLGIVFLALLVLMVVIMLLTKVFAVVTGRDLLSTAPVPAPSPTLVAPAGMAVTTPAPASVAADAAETVKAPLPGKVLSVAVKAGDRVRKGDELCVIEAMKMGNSVKAPREGTVREVLVAPGQAVAFGAPLLVLE
jgi:glutaconyl-CoA decarboxylase